MAMCTYEEALLLGPQGQSAKFTQIVVTGRHEAWAGGGGEVALSRGRKGTH